MLGLLMISAMAVAGVTLVMGDESTDNDENTNDAEDFQTSGGNSDDLVVRISSLTSSSDPGDVAASELGQVEYLGDGLVEYYADDSATTDPAELIGSAENNNYNVYSGVAHVVTGAGTDTVNARGMQAGIIRAGATDTVGGSDVITDGVTVGVVLDGAATFDGQSADELVVAIGDSASVNGGAGNDVLFSENGGATLNGGDGDDFIDAAAFGNEYNQSSNQTQGAPDAFVDVIDAGDGDDIVEDVANGDTVTLGSGNDLATAWYSREIAFDPVEFTDFNPAEDRVILTVQGFDMGQTGDPDVDYDLSGRFEILEADGDSHLFVDEELVAVFTNTLGLSVASTPFIDESRDIYEARLVLG